jgi:hypothetical protein
MNRSLIYTLTALVCLPSIGCSKSGAEGLSATTAQSKADIAHANSSANGTAKTSQKLIAVVDEEKITEDDIRPLMEAGVEKAIALDRYINKVIAAQAAEKQYKTDAQVAMKSVEREVLSQLFIQKTGQRIEGQISSADIQSYYDKNVKKEDFQQYDVSYYLTQDKSDAETVSQEALLGKREVLARFKPIREGADSYVYLKDMPYGLGQVIRQLKADSFSKPIALRNGFFVLHVIGIKEGKRPELSAVNSEIKTILMNQRLNKELEDHRSIAKIELK